ncbi:hypothetical protein M405DRAFT_839210 [Rhizopogon salebrosus TDB-379]|nr:hypothetical protein M405DRAFT_839210 [Rhizopogon salebrosus TDB-379]
MTIVSSGVDLDEPPWALLKIKDHNVFRINKYVGPCDPRLSTVQHTPEPEHAPLPSLVNHVQITGAVNAQQTCLRSKVVSRHPAPTQGSGTFVHHLRPSPAGSESKPHQLKDGDIVQLGVDYQGGTELIYTSVKIWDASCKLRQILWLMAKNECPKRISPIVVSPPAATPSTTNVSAPSSKATHPHSAAPFAAPSQTSTKVLAPPVGQDGAETDVEGDTGARPRVRIRTAGHVLHLRQLEDLDDADLDEDMIDMLEDSNGDVDLGSGDGSGSAEGMGIRFGHRNGNGGNGSGWRGHPRKIYGGAQPKVIPLFLYASYAKV